MNERKESAPTLVAIVPAAGIGSRMQREYPKQYLTIFGKTLLEYAIETLLKHTLVEHVVVALHRDDTRFHTLAIAKDARVSSVLGGESRAHSVLAALEWVTEHQPHYHWVMVHDAARPCLQVSDIEKLIRTVECSDLQVGGILATPIYDTIKQSQRDERKIAHSVDRTFIWRALTPQLFPVTLLKECLHNALEASVKITDEASALEHSNYHPHLVSGLISNIKVTEPDDLALATFYLSDLVK